jgi:hypothetical protein
MVMSMGLSKRVYIALFAVVAELVVVAASGNQGVTNFVADHMATSPLGDLFLRSLPSFPWRVTTEAHATGATTILVSQYAAIATLLVLTFVGLVLVVRGVPTFSGPFFAAIGVVVTASLVAHMVGEAVNYDQDGRSEHTGLGRFGYALFNSNNGLTVMYALMCGVVVAIVVGIVAVVMRARAATAADVAAASAEAEAMRAANPGFGAYSPDSAPAWGDAPGTGAYPASGYAAPLYGDQSGFPEPAGSVPPNQYGNLAGYGETSDTGGTLDTSETGGTGSYAPAESYPATNELPAVEHASGELPAVEHASGELPAVEHASGELPAVEHASGELPAVERSPEAGPAEH